MPTLNPPPYKFVRIRNGVAGTSDTLDLMTKLIERGKSDPVIRVFTADMLNHAGIGGGNSKNRMAEIATIFNFVREKIRYVWDVEGVETLQTPRFTLQHGYGDCDDKTTLVGSMLGSVGYRVKIEALGGLPARFQHVVAQVLIRTPGGLEWLTLDCTEDRGLGWAPPLPYRLPKFVK